MRLAPCCGCWKFVKVVAAIELGGWQAVPGLSPAVQFEAAAQIGDEATRRFACAAACDFAHGKLTTPGYPDAASRY
jgi:hypothetical protein